MSAEYSSLYMVVPILYSLAPVIFFLLCCFVFFYSFNVVPLLCGGVVWYGVVWCGVHAHLYVCVCLCALSLFSPLLTE